jgi:hypothetical protein
MRNRGAGQKAGGFWTDSPYDRTLHAFPAILKL